MMMRSWARSPCGGGSAAVKACRFQVGECSSQPFGSAAARREGATA